MHRATVIATLLATAGCLNQPRSVAPSPEPLPDVETPPPPDDEPEDDPVAPAVALAEAPDASGADLPPCVGDPDGLPVGAPQQVQVDIALSPGRYVDPRQLMGHLQGWLTSVYDEIRLCPAPRVGAFMLELTDRASGWDVKVGPDREHGAAERLDAVPPCLERALSQASCRLPQDEARPLQFRLYVTYPTAD